MNVAESTELWGRSGEIVLIGQHFHKAQWAQCLPVCFYDLCKQVVKAGYEYITCEIVNNIIKQHKTGKDFLPMKWWKWGIKGISNLN